MVTKASINRPNISLTATEIEMPPSSDYTITHLQIMLLTSVIQSLQLISLQILVQLLAP